MNEDTRCLIWNTPSKDIPVSRDGRMIDSSRAGGKYFISGTAEAMLENCDDHIKARLTTWLVEQRRLGVQYPEIHSWTIHDAEQWKDLEVSDRADNILKYLQKKSKILGLPIFFRSLVGMYQKPLDDSHITYLEFLAHSECIGRDDLDFLLNYLQESGFIERPGINNPEQTCVLTAHGYARLTELEKTYTASSRAFIAMWFDDSMNEVWERGFKPAIRKAGYKPIRIDKQEHVNKIDDEIIAEIRRSHFIVADFTHGNEGQRGGVYYEAGFAHGLDIPVIFTCHKDSFDEIHFDTRQYNHIVWSTPEELQENLVNRISAVVGDGPNKSSESQN